MEKTATRTELVEKARLLINHAAILLGIATAQDPDAQELIVDRLLTIASYDLTDDLNLETLLKRYKSDGEAVVSFPAVLIPSDLEEIWDMLVV
ncbi:MAG: hypothetical protein KAX05_15545 [Bacteroidales bacterium]|nr:hypothetical protein [Bacteroidales bacterium]